MSRVEFRILGPLEVWDGPERLDLSGMRQRIVLAALLLSANSVVTAGRLQEAVYGEDLPPTSRSQVQIAVSALRRLFATCFDAALIYTKGQGYVLELGDGSLDSRCFLQLTAAARAAAGAGRLEEAVAGYRDAERLWRGRALEGMESPLLEAAAAGLDEQRMAAAEDRLALELDLGRHREVVGELTGLVRTYPLRERLRAQLMLALYRCDRTAEALGVYRQGRHTLIEELGVEPGETLRRLHTAVLAGDPAIDPPSVVARVEKPKSRTVPRLLPGDTADFTSRADQVGQLRDWLATGPDAQAGHEVPIMVIAGQGGVGKTCFAVHAAHALVEQFRDGQLFADLHGVTAHPVGPAQVLERFLRALGVPGQQMPSDLDERAEMYRNLVADRRILVMLDDAAAEGQVTPLLPGTGPAAAIITSRSRLTGLAGASRIDLGVFTPQASVELLARIAGVGRVSAEPQAAAAVARQCGHLPLAVRIAGARLSARPHWTVGQLAGRLADETRRLDELRHGDLHVRWSISSSYNGVGEDARRLFRLLALFEQPVFSGWVSAPLLGMPYEQATELLDELVSAQLVEACGPAAGMACQYRFHDLTRVFARERLAAEDLPAERGAALQRALGGLLYPARQVRAHDGNGICVSISTEALRWPLPDQQVSEMLTEPLAWLERERLIAAARLRHEDKDMFPERPVVAVCGKPDNTLTVLAPTDDSTGRTRACRSLGAVGPLPRRRAPPSPAGARLAAR
jgi:DNA-binding SARP family transcriptional activator